ncbi:glycoside hydrolase family 2 [Stieleria sp. TO1_6]|uniref:glycoside hydrolase family 2 protein n=1 Tax=Stieleria tagensis TaxID=2956795 RepID=UPI00209B352B|nr:sugar-binding domain-containing protein [Stieleria tagensis]MCO8121152.1 glycoside hydrolase family 2 [Stieleria tagensis]
MQRPLIHTFLILVFVTAQAADTRAQEKAEPWKLPDDKMLTRWGKSLTPEDVWTEYPRPGLVRPQWTNLNGIWQYAVTNSTERPDQFPGSILVPFAIEAPLSGVGRLLKPEEVLWYRRTFEHSPIADQRLLLHFEAVDYDTEVFVNGKSIGTHVGSSDPFSFDITATTRAGINDLVVRVIDKTAVTQTRGKQKLQPKGIYYTRVSGIWQTVWMESVPQRRIASIKMKPRLYNGTLRVLPTLAGTPIKGEQVRITVSDADGKTYVADGSLMVHLADVHRWSPDDPYLYDIVVELLDVSGKTVDRVESYAGMREFDIARDAAGHLRMRLNGEFIFHYGTLDQGWWPDGLLTPPSDEAMCFDVDYLKAAGFNTIRKHIKVEPRRFYYHCDKVGMLVWQDMPSTGGGPKWTRMEPDPPEEQKPIEQHQQFIREMKAMVLNLQNHPCIAAWVPFNERWGQHESIRTAAILENLDVRRPINLASGGNFFPAGDIADQHHYPEPQFPLDDQRFKDYVKVVGEFGGHGYRVDDHLWNPDMKNWGYGGLPKDKAEFIQRYRTTFAQLVELREKGIAAGIYTQTTDVEGEINGLMTYDREVQKISTSTLSEIHAALNRDAD